MTVAVTVAGQRELCKTTKWAYCTTGDVRFNNLLINYMKCQNKLLLLCLQYSHNSELFLNVNSAFPEFRYGQYFYFTND